MLRSTKLWHACCAQAFQQTMDELSGKLSAMADLDDELKQLRTKLEMTAKQNADMLIKLQVWHCCKPCWSHVCVT